VIKSIISTYANSLYQDVMKRYGCQFLKEAHRRLKPGGQLILIAPNLSAWFNIFLLAIGQSPIFFSFCTGDILDIATTVAQPPTPAPGRHATEYGTIFFD